MVDRAARDRASIDIASFANGAITNREFEEGYPTRSCDMAVKRIFDQIWFFYDDVRTHRLTGDWALSPEDRNLFDRCVRFLRTDLEYPWPDTSFNSFWGLVRWLPPFKGWLDRRWEQFAAKGDIDAWPFISAADDTDESGRVVPAGPQG
ncbi:MAG TPA: hypothetical protein VFJ58_14925 [Armatimonadota bacterium]|nr:hypothetical protein [Armatimonadota bacterium]